MEKTAIQIIAKVIESEKMSWDDVIINNTFGCWGDLDVRLPERFLKVAYDLAITKKRLRKSAEIKKREFDIHKPVWEVVEIDGEKYIQRIE